MNCLSNLLNKFNSFISSENVIYLGLVDLGCSLVAVCQSQKACQRVRLRAVAESFQVVDVVGCNGAEQTYISSLSFHRTRGTN